MGKISGTDEINGNGKNGGGEKRGKLGGERSERFRNFNKKRGGASSPIRAVFATFSFEGNFSGSESTGRNDKIGFLRRSV